MTSIARFPMNYRSAKAELDKNLGAINAFLENVEYEDFDPHDEFILLFYDSKTPTKKTVFAAVQLDDHTGVKTEDEIVDEIKLDVEGKGADFIKGRLIENTIIYSYFMV